MVYTMVGELNMATSKSDTWRLDSGVSYHVCNDKKWFSAYKETTGQEVLMGNHSSAKILGEGTVELGFISGNMKVIHVPDIRKNMLSANLLCKNGFKIVLESNQVIISKNGVFVGKGYSCEGMFKVNINELLNVSVYLVDSPFLWHARLGYLNFTSLKYMYKHDYMSIKGEIRNNKCEICA